MNSDFSLTYIVLISQSLRFLKEASSRRNEWCTQDNPSNCLGPAQASRLGQGGHGASAGQAVYRPANQNTTRMFHEQNLLQIRGLDQQMKTSVITVNIS